MSKGDFQIVFLVNKFPELKEYVELMDVCYISKYVLQIIKEHENHKRNDAEKVESEDDLRMLKDNTLYKLYALYHSFNKEQRIIQFSEMLKKIVEIAADNGNISRDEMYNSVKYIEDTSTSYRSNYIRRTGDTETFEEMTSSSNYIRLGTFSQFYQHNTTKLGNMILVGARTGVGKTVMSCNLISDIVTENRDTSIRYYGTKEVSQAEFMKRLMVNRSPDNINGMFRDLSRLKDDISSTQSTIHIINNDSANFVSYLKRNINDGEFYNIKNDLLSVEKRLEELEKLKGEQETSSGMKQITSEIESVETKKSIEQRKMYSITKRDIKLLTVIEDVFRHIDNYTLDVDWNFLKDAGSAYNYDKFKEIIGSPRYESKRRKYNEGIGTLATTVEYINEMFSKYYDNICSAIIWLGENTEKLDDGVLEDVITQLGDILETKKEEARKLTENLKKEYNKVETFLKKSEVVVSDNLNVNKIRRDLKQFRKRNPNKKLVVIVDYQQQIKGYGQLQEFEHSKRVGEDFLELSSEYNALIFMMTQLNDMDLKKQPLNARPTEAHIRGGEGTSHSTGTIAVILNRNGYDGHKTILKERANTHYTINQDFKVYEIYFTKNRYGANGHKSSVQYYIFNGQKMAYYPINKKHYPLLSNNPELLYLDDIVHKLKTESGYETMSKEEIKKDIMI